MKTSGMSWVWRFWQTMTDRWIVGSHWVGVGDIFVRIDILEGDMVFYVAMIEQGFVHKTSRPMFELFFRRLEPEEEGLMLLSQLDE